MRPSASLRTVVGTVVTVVAALALATAAALVYLTTELRGTTDEARAALESLRLAEDAAVALLLHARVGDALARGEVERQLRENVERARSLARGDAERAVARAAAERVDDYLAVRPDAPGGAALEDAFAAIDALVATNVRQSLRADARAQRLDRLGDAIGVGTAVLLVASVGWLLWWLRSRAFQPLLGLAGAMTRFGAGETSARAPEAGPAELRAMARRFNEMAAALAALRERQMTFLAALAHDLRNPLSALKLATSRGRGGGEAQDPTLALVGRQVLALERLVTDFLDTARIEAGRLELRPQRVDVRGIVSNVVSLFGATARGHRISLRMPDEEVVAACDPGRVEQVLNNLVSNAIKYSPVGGHIEVGVDGRADAVAVRVVDEGVGIDGADAEAIFEPFRRGRAQPDVPGVGLGLYVSKRIVEAHGGEIRVSSEPGRGSTFEVVLPR